MYVVLLEVSEFKIWLVYSYSIVQWCTMYSSLTPWTNCMSCNENPGIQVSYASPRFCWWLAAWRGTKLMRLYMTWSCKTMYVIWNPYVYIRVGYLWHPYKSSQICSKRHISHAINIVKANFRTLHWIVRLRIYLCPRPSHWWWWRQSTSCTTGVVADTSLFAFQNEALTTEKMGNMRWKDR